MVRRRKTANEEVMDVAAGKLNTRQLAVSLAPSKEPQMWVTASGQTMVEIAS